MGVDEKFKQINVVWDRVEVRSASFINAIFSPTDSLPQKVIYLFIDMALNAYFIISVKRRLVAYGVRISLDAGLLVVG